MTDELGESMLTGFGKVLSYVLMLISVISIALAGLYYQKQQSRKLLENPPIEIQQIFLKNFSNSDFKIVKTYDRGTFFYQEIHLNKSSHPQADFVKLTQQLVSNHFNLSHEQPYQNLQTYCKDSNNAVSIENDVKATYFSIYYDFNSNGIKECQTL